MHDGRHDGAILLVEDDPGVAQLIQFMCGDLDLPVVHVATGRAAVAWLREQQPLLLLLDYSLPDMNAAQLLAALQESQIPAPPFVVTTGAGDERIAVDMMRRGARDYVVKGAQFLHELENTVQKVLRVLATERQLAEAQAELLRLNQNLERRVEERTAELSASNAALKRASRMKDEFLASVSHELRTPLTGILGFTEGLLEQVPGPLNERQLRYVNSIHKSGQHLLDLINGILDFSALEAGQMQVTIDPGYVDDICRGSLALVSSVAEKKGIELAYERSAANLLLMTDGRRLKQVLVNLLSNAIKFTPAGGAVGLDVTADAAEEVCWLTVWDRGIGIAPDDQQRIFQPFTQLDSRLTRQYAGTGLGLALVQRMVNLLGGSVTVESAPGAGSRFTVALAWRPPAAEGREPLPVLTVRGGAAPRILLAEEGELAAAEITTLLDAWGCGVTVVRRSEDILHTIREQAPDAVIAAVQMAGAENFALCNRIRGSTDPTLAATPVILTAVLVVAGEEARAVAAGADAFLPKPPGAVTLHSALTACLRQEV